MPTYRRRQLAALRQALDEARFGPKRTLNLRASLPTVQEAVQRADAWLRQRQVEQAGEVLVVTGRGNNSEGGVSPVREGVYKLLRSLRRAGVVERVEEHTPGSFVVTLAEVRALWDAPRRKGGAASRAEQPPPSLSALDADTRALLRDLAMRSLDALGVRDARPFLEGEMLKQFGRLAASIAGGPDREARLRTAIRAAMAEYDAES